jgi:hypothetical protein
VKPSAVISILARAGRLGRLVPMGALLLAAVAARADDSLARVVPADVGLFVELRQADDLLTQLVEPQLWLTLAELAGQPASLKETDEWRRRVERTVNMSPADAIRALFSQRVAFVAEGPHQTQDAVVLCRPAGDKRELLRRWQARPLPTTGRTAVYSLANNVGLAVHDDLLVFGDQATGGMFSQVLSGLGADDDDAPVLADDPVYRRLLARVPADPDAVFFVRLDGEAPASAPAASHPARPALRDLPQLLRGSSNVLLALHRADQVLHISVVGDAPSDSSTSQDARLGELVSHLPAQTLLAWAGAVDYPSLTQIIATLPERNVFRVAYQLHARAGTVQHLLAAMNPATCVALGTVMPENRVLPAPPVPALALLVALRDPESAATEWANLFHTTLGLYRLLSLKLAAPPALPPVTNLLVADAEVEELDLSGLLGAEPGQSPLGELHVCWAVDGDALIIATHLDWLRQILEARHSDAPCLSAALASANGFERLRAQTLVIGQTGALADFGGFWLRFCEKFLPEILTEDWWRKYQPGGGNVRLGVQVSAEPQRPRLRVRSVTPDTPADGVLRPGDEIIGCNRRRFATSQPVNEIQMGLASRPNARWIDLLVERDRVVRVKRIPVPFVDPVEIVRRIVAIGHVVQRIVYIEDAPDSAGARGYLTLELRTDQQPQFEFPPPPVSRPATAAASTRTTSR